MKETTLSDEKAKPTPDDEQVSSDALLAELRGILERYADEDEWSEITVPVQGMYISNGHTEDHYTECYVDGMFKPAQRGLEILSLLSANA